MPAWRAIVFDLDDTLYPERTYVLSGFRAVAAWVEEHLSIPQHQSFAELRRLFDEGIWGNTFDCWLESYGLEPNRWVAQMVRVYREHNPHIAPYPEVAELLQRLSLHYRLGLVSDGYAEVQKRKLTALGLAPCFDVLVFSDEWGREAWKPSSRPFEIVLKRLGVIGSEAVYVGDNPSKDFLGAREVGMRTVRVHHPDGLYSHLEPPSPEYAPDVEIKTLSDLEASLMHT
jgi:putative hydrolase of the HAD superfamily